jgi:hypothetical protein
MYDLKVNEMNEYNQEVKLVDTLKLTLFFRPFFFTPFFFLLQM